MRAALNSELCRQSANSAPPKITVVTCSYNQGPFLEETIQSVINQGYPNLEYIIIDGGSKDESVEIIRKYESDLAFWVSEPDRGQGDALWKGFARATGDILCWLCSDDLLEEGALLEVGRIFADNPSFEVIYGDTIFIDKFGAVTRYYKTVPFNRWLLLNTWSYIPQPSTFWRRGLYEKVGGLNRTLEVAMDPDLWLRFSEITRLNHICRYWSRMRIYPEIMAVARKDENLAVHRMLENRYLGPRSERVRVATRAVAKLIRIGFRLCFGCFWSGAKKRPRRKPLHA
jgi:glycosyltransferase involved in cell wall biosynthesis